MSVGDLPEQLAIINSVGANHSIGPATEDDLVREDGAQSLNAVISFGNAGVGLGDAPCND